LLAWEEARQRRTLARIRTEMKLLDAQMAALKKQQRDTQLALALLLLYVRQEQEPDRWLYFDSGNPEEDKALDLLVPTLVIPRLAAMSDTQLAEKRYLYELRPDWKAIEAAVHAADLELPAEVMDWLAEQS